ncbi:MAG: MBL fold metallo-hydrolase [Clostridiales bacterium]|nr:MBL fold metallo-hydrolase [Clostridiales bacterium]
MSERKRRSRRRKKGRFAPSARFAAPVFAVLVLIGVGLAGSAMLFGSRAAGGSVMETGAVAEGKGATEESVTLENVAEEAVTGEIMTEGEKPEEERDETPILGGAVLTMLASQTEGQMMSFLLETAEGSLIVVDGGRWDDADYLMEQIRACGGHVNAWFLTHAHTDHVGSLLKLLTDEADGVDTGIEIDHIYYNFADISWYMVHELGDLGTAGSIISYLDALPASMRHTVSRGDVITVDGVTVTVMNDRYEPDADHVGERDGNDASIAYRMLVNGVSILFLGDLQQAGGEWLLAESGGDLKSDIVQMAHHGQNGVGEEVYQAIDPSICLWPCPQWLWDNEGDAYRTPETKAWVQKLHVEKHYSAKDGDQTIR